jgi:hypothetical protein
MADVIEQRLRETLDKVTAHAPDEADAFERFLRRRARRTRRVATATALALVLLLGSVVAVPSLVLSGRPPAVAPPGHGPRLLSAGEPTDRRWFPGPLVAAAPNQGFEAEVPAGWEARPTWKGFELRPVSQELRRRLVRPAELDTTYLEAFYQPAGRTRYRDGSQLPDSALLRTPAGPELTRGRFAGGRPWFRTDGRSSGLPTNWYVSWPYHCTGGWDCPEVLTLRTLHLSYQVEQAEAAAAAAGLAERVLGSARPTGNAVAGRAHAPRPDCVDGRTVETDGFAHGLGPERGGRPSAFAFFWEFRTTGQLIPCTVRGPVGVELLDGAGRRLEVRGNGRGVSPVGNLPETSTGRDGTTARKVGTIALTVVWRNWCGEGRVRVRWIGTPAARRHFLPGPACVDPSQPSVLSVERTPP